MNVEISHESNRNVSITITGVASGQVQTTAHQLKTFQHPEVSQTKTSVTLQYHPGIELQVIADSMITRLAVTGIIDTESAICAVAKQLVSFASNTSIDEFEKLIRKSKAPSPIENSAKQLQTKVAIFGVSGVAYAIPGATYDYETKSDKLDSESSDSTPNNNHS